MGQPAIQMAKYNVTVNREIFIFGSAEEQEKVKRILAPLTFLMIREISLLEQKRPDMHFLIGFADFSDPRKLQYIARSFAAVKAQTAHKVIYANSPDRLSKEHLLFGAELGARFTAQGATKDEDLRKYIKKICVDVQEATSIAYYEQEMEKHYLAGDEAKLQVIAERLSEMPKDNEEVLRAQCLLSQYQGKFEKVEFYLKRLLQTNPQSLWAANGLGRLYLRSGRIAEGIELLEKLSQFHELNSERFLELGNAYINIGDAEHARNALEKGAELIQDPPGDERFKESKAKAEIIDRDAIKALSYLPKPYSADMVAFLNMRAIIMMREGKKKEAMELYRMAWEGMPSDRIMRAKLRFNMGIGYVKVEQIDQALACFDESVRLGGADFGRAQRPLLIAKNVALAKKKNQPPAKEDERWTDELEWEHV